MRAGRLRRRVTLQRKAEVPDGGGGVEEGWGDVATVWARVVPLEGRERFQAGQLEPVADHRVEIRYREGVTARDMRVLYGARPLRITGVIDVEDQRKELHLMCIEQPA